MTAEIALAIVDINPPVWWEEDNTTWQTWSFYNSDSCQVEPDSVGYGNLLGTCLTVTPASETAWLDEDNTYQYMTVYDVGYGVWQLSGGSIEAFVENYDLPDYEKQIWIQLTWRPQNQGDSPSIYLEDPSGGQTGPVTNPINITQLGSGWIHSTYQILLGYNPPNELIRISGLISVDDLVIDTWCLPEPATLVMLSIGSFALIRMKK